MPEKGVHDAATLEYLGIDLMAQTTAEMLDIRDTATRVVRARRPGAEEEDIIQEAWATVVLTLRSRTVDNPSAYAAATAANLVRMHGRREATRRRRAPRLFMRATVDAPDAEIVHREEQAAMTLALSRLPETMRELLVAHTVHDLDTAALADAAGTTAPAIAAALARARAALRVEYLIAFRRLPPPDDNCRRVLYAVSGADSRRQTRLNATGHLSSCPSCAPLVDGLRDRRRAGIGAIVGLRMSRWVTRAASVETTTFGQRFGSPGGVLGAAGLAGVGVVSALALSTGGQTTAAAAAAPRAVAPVHAVAPSHPPMAAAVHVRPAHAAVHNPGKNNPISRVADSAPSLPCTKFSVSKMPRSPRIVPGDASAGLVPPISVRTTLQVSSGPSTTNSIAGPLVMKDTRSPKNGLPSCSP